MHEVFEEGIKLSCEKWIESMFTPRAEVLATYKKAAIRRWQETHLQERMKKEIEECARLWESPAHHQAVSSFLKR